MTKLEQRKHFEQIEQESGILRKQNRLLFTERDALKIQLQEKENQLTSETDYVRAIKKYVTKMERELKGFQHLVKIIQILVEENVEVKEDA